MPGLAFKAFWSLAPRSPHLYLPHPPSRGLYFGPKLNATHNLLLPAGPVLHLPPLQPSK